MRVCIVGNSHIAALKLAERSAEAAEMEFTFFGVPAGRFHKIYCEEGIIKGHESIHPSLLRTSGGQYTQINPAYFDAVMFHGIDFSPDAAIYSIGRKNQGTRVMFSHAFMRAGLASWLERTRAFNLARAIAGKSAAKVMLSPMPCPAKEPDDEEDQVSIPLLLRLRPVVLDILENACADAGLGLLRQPIETYSDRYYTKSDYTKGSVRLVDPTKEHDEDDNSHMNAEYGALVLGQLQEMLRAAPVPQA